MAALTSGGHGSDAKCLPSLRYKNAKLFRLALLQNKEHLPHLGTPATLFESPSAVMQRDPTWACALAARLGSPPTAGTNHACCE